ncbi:MULTISPECIES: SDR family oxidoreductase [unclassified Herbaspirillum]|uniref:SDR family oxidoreductase n=1 Tax=unclassified Herbaspirillum TaxID=2624150 RepID=UPI000E2ED696|nr:MULTISPECIES: SDR family oxidoreductase [unclassified Herbaspirillum]RFB73594.1 SDR family NAD(P)-dependent oxidoreductase [Herbaspirillum sp. 3R-3a1]TFI10604.1 SDR family NAD(P)-dependent oxidoreductase [Herbaspirillum sp. 3R11]TFI16511.1 SDR family NAD(P)-dependent oxidoreductase [Herbaspirillum sp. 3R-11]TFI19467.1 SDR family NAD(P)-dependent oxidoreductase [Herbaspirillum sp. 3C11]
MANGKNVLVLGATGGIGGEMAQRLYAQGWHVRALHRQAEQVAARPGMRKFDWISGDAMQRADVVAAARGVDVIVHAVNPPGYRRWAELVLPMMDNSIAAAQAFGARIVLPGTVYNYGPDVLPELHVDSPQHPVTRKGAIRVQMEQRLQTAAADGVRSLIVRAGDFFGPQAGNNWFSMGLVKPGKTPASIIYPGKRGVGHQWTYLPDLAETMARLLERESSLETFARFHMNGHWDADGTQMTEAIRRVLGNARLPVRSFPWWLLGPAAPFVPLFREMKEMRYLWQQPVRMDNVRLLQVLGEEPHTPLDEAVRATLRGLGCLPSQAGTQARAA